MSVFPGIGRLCPLPFPYQHHSNPSGLPRPQRVSTCPPLERGAEGLPWLAPLPENPFFPCSDPSPPRRILTETSQLLFDPHFFQTALASLPPGRTRGPMAAESTPLESQRSAQAPEGQHLLTLERGAEGHPLACPAAGKPVLSVFPSALFPNSFWQASPPWQNQGPKGGRKKAARYSRTARLVSNCHSAWLEEEDSS